MISIDVVDIASTPVNNRFHTIPQNVGRLNTMYKGQIITHILNLIYGLFCVMVSLVITLFIRHLKMAFFALKIIRFMPPLSCLSPNMFVDHPAVFSYCSFWRSILLFLSRMLLPINFPRTLESVSL